jgi:hypothetical protein
VAFQDGSTSLGSAAVNGNAASLTLSSLPIGSHSITAVYSGDGNVTGSSSAALTQTVNKAATTAVVISSGNPSSVGSAVTFTITVSPQFSSSPTGTVMLKNGGSVLATLGLNSGQASYTNTYSGVGTFSITAVYGGDAHFTSSISPILRQVVNKIATSTDVTSSSNPINAGQAVTFTATVSSNSGAPPDGEIVDFKDGSTTLGTGPLSRGIATLTTSALAAGNRSITAKYLGDTKFSTSTSSILRQRVTQAKGAATLTPSSYNFGQVPVTSPLTYEHVDVGIINTGTVPITISSTTITGPEGLDDGKYLNPLGCKVIAVGATCYITLRIAGDGDDAPICQPCNDILFVNFTDGTSVQFPYSFSVPNTSVRGSVTPTSINFGTVQVGVATSRQTITITNSSPGQGIVTVGQVTVADNNGTTASFFIDSDPCSNTSIPPGTACQVTLYAKPTRIGASSGVATIPTNLGNTSRKSVPVYVTGH